MKINNLPAKDSWRIVEVFDDETWRYRRCCVCNHDDISITRSAVARTHSYLKGGDANIQIICINCYTRIYDDLTLSNSMDVHHNSATYIYERTYYEFDPVRLFARMDSTICKRRYAPPQTDENKICFPEEKFGRIVCGWHCFNWSLHNKDPLKTFPFLIKCLEFRDDRALECFWCDKTKDPEDRPPVAIEGTRRGEKFHDDLFIGVGDVFIDRQQRICCPTCYKKRFYLWWLQCECGECEVDWKDVGRPNKEGVDVCNNCFLIPELHEMWKCRADGLRILCGKTRAANANMTCKQMKEEEEVPTTRNVILQSLKEKDVRALSMAIARLLIG